MLGREFPTSLQEYFRAFAQKKLNLFLLPVDQQTALELVFSILAGTLFDDTSLLITNTEL